MREFECETLARSIDHAVLKPNASELEVREGAKIAMGWAVAAYCVQPIYAQLAVDLLAECPAAERGSSSAAVFTVPCCVVGFPHGTSSVETKAAEARAAIQHGVKEIDVVAAIGLIKSARWCEAADEIHSLAQLAHDFGARIKVIFENAYLDDVEKIYLCEICSEARVDWVKTSTGFAATGATLEDVALMKKHVSSEVQVKASGGIRDLDAALSFLAVGATRIGTSSTVKILSDAKIRMGVATSAIK